MPLSRESASTSALVCFLFSSSIAFTSCACRDCLFASVHNWIMAMRNAEEGDGLYFQLFQCLAFGTIPNFVCVECRRNIKLIGSGSSCIYSRSSPFRVSLCTENSSQHSGSATLPQLMSMLVTTQPRYRARWTYICLLSLSSTPEDILAIHTRCSCMDE